MDANETVLKEKRLIVWLHDNFFGPLSQEFIHKHLTNVFGINTAETELVLAAKQYKICYGVEYMHWLQLFDI